MNISVLGIDIAKNIFQLNDVDKTGRTTLKNEKYHKFAVVDFDDG